MALVSAKFSRLLDSRLTKVFENKFKEQKRMVPFLYTEFDSDQAFNEYWEIGEVPDIVPFSGAIEYLDVAPGYYNKIEPGEFAAGLMFERKLVDDKKYPVLDGRTAGLAVSANRVIEKYGVKPFALGETASFDFQVSEEGVALFSSSHSTKSGTSTASGFDNAGTSAISPTVVEATRVLMRKFRNSISERIDGADPNAIIHPDSLTKRVVEIIGTPAGLDTAYLNKNINYQGYKSIPYSRMDDTSTTSWIMVDFEMMKKYMVFINRIKAEFFNTNDFETLMRKYAVYTRFGLGFLEWRWGYKHIVA